MIDQLTPMHFKFQKAVEESLEAHLSKMNWKLVGSPTWDRSDVEFQIWRACVQTEDGAMYLMEFKIRRQL